jgi:ribosomal 50S subunit-recycling heat shock protein
MAATKTTAPKIKVTLKTVHTHAGKECKKGDQIEVTHEQKTWMAKRGLIEGEG